MKANATDLKKLLKPINELEDGTYWGEWGGYTVDFTVTNEETGEHNYQIKTDRGLRGTRIPCSITIDDGNMTVETI